MEKEEISKGLSMDRHGRIKYLQDMLKEEGLGCALLFYSRDIFYYTGTAQPSYLVVLPNEYLLYVRSGFEFAVNEVFIEKEKIREERRLENIYQELAPKLQHRKIATELDVLTAIQFSKFQEIFSGYEFVNGTPHILEQRKRKESFEISRIKEALRVLDKGHQAILTSLKKGVTELELAAAVENAHRLAGHEGIFFIRQPDFFMGRGPISSGSNLFRISGVVYTITGVGLSPSVPAGPSRRKIMGGEPVMVDIPTLVNGYHADQTRTYILGRAPEQIKRMYDNLKEIADYLINRIAPGMGCSEIFQMAIKKSEDLKVSDAFMNMGKGKSGNMIGHGIGVELNEPPILSNYDHTEISEGFVIALDLHILRENVGVVKLEDMIRVGKNENEILNISPRRLFEIEG